MSLFSTRQKRKAASHERFNALMSNAPEALTPAVTARFEAGDRPARIVGVHADSIEVALSLASPGESVPTTNVVTTEDGPDLRPATKAERAEWYRQYVASQVLLIGEECFAVGPLIAGVTVVASYGGLPLVASCLRREALDAADWGRGPWDVLLEADPSLQYHLGGPDRELRPIEVLHATDLSVETA